MVTPLTQPQPPPSEPMAKPSYKFQGWTGHDDQAVYGRLELEEFEPKAWDEYDVDVKILYCGMCGSDASALAGELGPVTDRVCGHEIVGEVVRVGARPENRLKVGDIVGIGPQCDSCRECEWCHKGEDQFCPDRTRTYGGDTYKRGHAAGTATRGGFASYWRGPSRWAIPLPEGLDPALAAPLMCAGNTVYAPLKRFGAGSSRAKKVGVVGIGGLGHMAIMLATAMGAEVTAISRGDAKREDAERLGAKHYIATGPNLGEDFRGHERSLDLVICTINPRKLPINEYLTLLRPEGTFVIQGVIMDPMKLSAFPLLMVAGSVAGSNPCGPARIREVLDLAVKRGIKPWIQKYDMGDINRALVDFRAGRPSYRFVLVNIENGGEM